MIMPYLNQSTANVMVHFQANSYHILPQQYIIDCGCIDAFKHMHLISIPWSQKHFYA